MSITVRKSSGLRPNGVSREKSPNALKGATHADNPVVGARTSASI
jgi:hypothetical protein